MFNIFEAVGSVENTMIVMQIIIAILAVLALIYSIICFLAPIYIYFMHDDMKSMKLKIEELAKQNDDMAVMIMRQLNTINTNEESNEKPPIH